MILVPVKNLSGAKQRLASLLDQGTRTELAQTMLKDVAETLASLTARPEIALVTGDPFARELATRFGFEVIPDSANRGETDAIEMATQICESRGANFTLVIPGDIPLVQAWELEKILESAPDQGSVLVPAADGRGTNAALRRPAGLFPLRFGNDSFKPHLAAARASGKPVVVVPLSGIALDVDTATDLWRLAESPGTRHSQLLVRELDLADLPRAANE
ncbi:MAG: 2-phospho-L-lactate guanylyltransferase [Terriglobales bacterium]